MPPLPVRQDQYFRTLLPDHARDLQSVLPGVLDAAIGNIERVPPRNFQDPSGFGRLACAVSGCAARSHFALSEIEDTGAIAAGCHLEQSSAAGLLDIVTMCGKSEDVERFHGWHLALSI